VTVFGQLLTTQSSFILPLSQHRAEPPSDVHSVEVTNPLISWDQSLAKGP